MEKYTVAKKDAGENNASEDQAATSNAAKEPIFDKSIVDDVPVTIDAILGDARMTVSDLMNLQDGSVITLDASLNHRAELRLNDKVIGYGEIVSVGENFGIRITEIGD